MTLDSVELAGEQAACGERHWNANGETQTELEQRPVTISSQAQT